MSDDGLLVKYIGSCSACGQRRYRYVDDNRTKRGDLCNFCRKKAGKPMIKNELYSVPFSVRDEPGERTTPPSTGAPSPAEGPPPIMVGKCKVCGKKMYKPAGVRGRNPKKHKKC